jgi:hypothetical protein
MGSISQSEKKGGDFEEMLQKLIDWKEAGVPKRDGTREGERQLFNLRKNKRQTYNGFIETLGSFEAENEYQKQQVAKWSKLFNERLARIETVWEQMGA